MCSSSQIHTRSSETKSTVFSASEIITRFVPPGMMSEKSHSQTFATGIELSTRNVNCGTLEQRRPEQGEQKEGKKMGTTILSRG